MTTDILVRRLPDGTYSIVSGHRRLQALLEKSEQVEVWDCENQAKIIVHEVGGVVMALSEGAMGQIKQQAALAIERARLGVAG